MDFFHTSISPKAIELARETLQSTFISEGKRVKEFEDKLSSQLGLVNPVALNSGTSALHLALAIAGVGEGDEVIIPAQTFISTGMVVLMQRARPVFADIQYKTGNIDPISIKQKITKNTKAVIPVHWAGYPCDIDGIQKIASNNNLIVIEDAAHALGAKYKDKPIGSVSRFTTFSFQAIKHLTTGDGGALCCLEENDYREARKRRWLSIDRDASKPSILGEREYDSDVIGYKYHMNDLAASVGLGNLEEFDENLQRRKEIAKHYRSELNDIPGFTLLDYKDDRESACWLFTILVDRREDFIRKLNEKGIPSSVVHLRIDDNSVFEGPFDLPNQNRFNENQVAIPLHPALTDMEVNMIIDTIKKGW